MEFGDWARAAREKAKMSVKELAEAVETSPTGIYQTESGKYTPRLVTARKISEALGYPLWKALKQIEESGHGKRAKR